MYFRAITKAFPGKYGILDLENIILYYSHITTFVLYVFIHRYIGICVYT